ncbi:MAG: flippase-like domain-containing protein [Geodermatophilaceae bacterium]|nr:flippase-like domain-containing protein [Geodermatophilaceae bacterium]
MRRTRLQTWVRGLGIAVAVLAVGLCLKTLVDQWSSIGPALRQTRAEWMVLAGLCSAVGMVGLAVLWWRCLRLYGTRTRLSDTTAWYFAGELGKYLPGGVWSVLGRGELAQRGGVGRGHAYSTTLVSYASMCIAAAIVCGGLAPLAARDGGLEWGWAALALVPLGCLAVHPSVVGPVLSAVARLTRGRLVLAVRPWGSMLGLVLWSAPTWILIGAASCAVTAALGYDQQPARVAFAAVAAWILGFLAVPVPAGAGVRELVFVVLSGLAAGPATAVAALARLLLVAVDALGGLVGLWWARSARGGTEHVVVPASGARRSQGGGS